MGSRYDGEPRSYRDGPAPRWDTERFSREREERFRSPPQPGREREREKPYEGYGRRMEERFAPPPPRPAEPRFEERFFAEERYGPPARRVDKKFYEEDEVYDARPPPGGAMIPYRPQRPQAPPRPGLLRRQSSLDTFDRKPPRRYNDFEEENYRPPHVPPVIPVPVPRRPSPPRYAPRYADRGFEEFAPPEPAYYGGEEVRAYKEREWMTSRKKGRDSSPEYEEREEVIEERLEEEKPFPRRGKTRMPKRLIHTRVLLDLGYPYHEEGEMIIIEKALSKEQIDEVVGTSKVYREKEEVTTVHLIEASAETLPLHEAPRSVREWDALHGPPSARSPSPSIKSHKSQSRRPSRSRRGSSPKTEIIEERKTVIRESSPARTERTRRKSLSPARTERSRRKSVSPAHTERSRRKSTVAGTEIIERREIIEEDDFGESSSFHAGPLALISHERKSERDIQAEIRALELERKALKLERRLEKEHRKAERLREGEREIIIEREIRRPAEDIIEVKKDRKAPDSRIIRAMMATLT